MANILDYIHWRGDLSFESSPMNILDNLIFAELTYIDYAGHVPEYPNRKRVLFKNAIKRIFEEKDKKNIVLGLIVPHTVVDLLDEAKETKRFGDCYVSNYVNYVNTDEKCQFSAITYHFGENELYVGFRGTDDTLIGWQENVDMLYANPVGAQIRAKEYLDKIAQLYPDAKIYLGGHSKGGNLANYAAIYAEDEVKERIVYCYSNDGQGMDKQFVDMEKYESIKKKIIRIIPESDVVGMIFDVFAGKSIIVKSTNRGIYQHDGFSWQIRVTDFDTVPEVSKKAKKLDTVITRMIKEVPKEDKIGFGQNLYDFIIASQLNTLMDCKKESIRLIKYMSKFNSKSRRIFFQLVSEFMFF